MFDDDSDNARPVHTVSQSLIVVNDTSHSAFANDDDGGRIQMIIGDKFAIRY